VLLFRSVAPHMEDKQLVTVGIIGLGRMGGAIARRMADQGRSVLGWTRSGRAVDGVESTADLDRLVETSDTLILSLLDDAAVSDVLGVLLSRELKGKQIIETSTVTPGLLIDRIDRIHARGAMAVDAPISGGPELVLAGQCGVFIGGDDIAAARARESLTAISGRIFHVGPLGTGLVMKTINNSMVSAYFSGLTDLLPLARKAGLPLETALRILCGGPAGLPFVADRIPKVMGEDKSVGFPLSGIFKDMDVFQRILESYDLSSPIVEKFLAQKPSVIHAGLWERDGAELINLAYYGSEPS
jgi:3-hydroxyisobutyrate dehydrogenase